MASPSGPISEPRDTRLTLSDIGLGSGLLLLAHIRVEARPDVLRDNPFFHGNRDATGLEAT
jgi:hypothetical protein